MARARASSRCRGALALLSLALLPHTLGCSWIRASQADYADYRPTRIAPTFEQRLKASALYLERHPEGAYADDVRRYFKRAEPAFYASRQRDVAGLEAYLRVLPNGPHAAEVRSRLSLLAEQAGRPDPMLVAAQATEARLEAASKSRDKAHGELAFWLESLADPAAYKQPLAEGPADLVTAYSLALPAPLCRADAPGRSCDKDIVMLYQVPTSRGLVERELTFSVTLRMDEAGRPLWGRIEGEELFSRLEETYAKKQLDAEGFSDRVAAVERGVEVIAGAFEARVSLAPTCKQPVVAPVILRLECEGMRVVGTAGTEPGAPDIVSFEPLSPPPAP